MPVHTICPNGHSLSIKGKYAGKDGLCPICKEPIKVPLSETAVLPAYSILAMQQMDDSGVSMLMSASPDPVGQLGELLPAKGGDPIPLDQRVLLVGRTEDCNIVLRSASISRHHATLKVVGNRWCVEDNSSVNGIRVNGRVVKNAWLGSGDLVTFAKYEYKISYSQDTLAALPPLPDADKTLGELASVQRGGVIPLQKRRLLVGRGQNCDIVLPFPTISLEHAELRIVRDYWWVEDCESTNGIEVNGGVVFTEKLNPGDVVAFAEHEYRIHYTPMTLAASDPVWHAASSPVLD